MFTLDRVSHILVLFSSFSLPSSEISSFAVNLSTGSSVEEQSGSISITVGTSEQGQGSNLVLQSGRSLDEDELGGSTLITAGNGSGGGGSLLLRGGIDFNKDEDITKVGGNVKIEGGISSVGNGGSVFISGGSSEQGIGGHLNLVSGYSNSQASGDTLLATADGSILEKSSSGNVIIKTGESYDESNIPSYTYVLNNLHSI